MAGEEQTILRAQIELSDTKAHLFAFPDLQSTICSLNLLFGGIAQLVERQLCKLEVRGSNPLASNSMNWRQRLGSASVSRVGFGVSPKQS